MSIFAKKKILLVAPIFFGYEKEIEFELIRLGAKVDRLPDRPFNSPLAKALMRLCRRWFIPLLDAFFSASIKKLGVEQYDAVFVIQGEGLSKGMLVKIKQMFPDTYLVLYMWDSMRNKRALIENLPFYDATYSFDKTDSETLNMRFRPLFFLPRFQDNRSSERKYDLSFIGTAHSDRYNIISHIERNSPYGIRFYKYLFMQAKWLFVVKKVFITNFRDSYISDFEFTALSGSEVQRVFSQSLAIVDIEHPRQTGLTMRTFETLGAGKKLVTTNIAVKGYDFFDSQNILVLDRNSDFDIPESFFSTPYRPVGLEVVNNYTLNRWLIEIFSSSSWV